MMSLLEFALTAFLFFEPVASTRVLSPAWVVEQYERANPFYKEVLTVLQGEELRSNKALLKRTKREMMRRKLWAKLPIFPVARRSAARADV